VLAKEATALTQEARAQIAPLSSSAQTATDSAASAAQQVEGAAAQFTLTANDINRLIGENRGTLVDTLGNVQAASQQLRVAADTLGPTLQSGELVGDLEALVGNASAASADLQAITASLNTPANLVLLQQTLESARDALASAQKVMADVDEITGDPAVRDQLRNLINGLGDLVSSTRSLEQQSEVAQALGPLSAQIRAAEANIDAEAEEAITAPPVLVFDGERYVLQPAGRLANSPNSKALKESDRHVLTKPSR
jgi:phospholipid/cholesterol/gamma-HCH transport system substrate-binding protein